MDSHPLLQAPSQDTCAYFQRTSESASAPSSQCPTFPSERAAHYSRLFRFVNTSFRGPTPPLLPQTRRLSVEASRLLWQPFRCRQHLREGDFNFLPSPPTTGRRRRSGSMRPPLRFGKRQNASRAFMPRPTGTSCPAWLRRGVRRRPAVPARTCACPPATGLRNPAAAPSAHPRRRYRPPSPHAP